MASTEPKNMIITTIAKNINSNITLTNTDIGICFDTSNHRLGINTFNPNYGIDNLSDMRVSGEFIAGTISAEHIDVYSINSNIIDVSFLDASSINVYLLDVSRLDVSFINFNTISGDHIDVYSISANTIDVSLIDFYTISGNHINVNTISANTIDVSLIDANTISAERIFFNSISGGHIRVVSLSADSIDLSGINYHGSSNISVNNADKTISLKNNISISSATIQELYVESTDGIPHIDTRAGQSRLYGNIWSIPRTPVVELWPVLVLDTSNASTTKPYGAILYGNAYTATSLQNDVSIAGLNFNGTQPIGISNNKFTDLWTTKLTISGESPQAITFTCDGRAIFDGGAMLPMVAFTGYWGGEREWNLTSVPVATPIIGLSVTNDIQAANIYCTSDDRMKHNQINISGSIALSTLRKLNPQLYKKTTEMYAADFSGEITGNWKPEMGLIAQDIMQIPELAFCVAGGDYTDANGNLIESKYILNYDNIFVMHIAATKELDSEVTELKIENNNLKARVSTLETQMANILSHLNLVDT